MIALPNGVYSLHRAVSHVLVVQPVAPSQKLLLQKCCWTALRHHVVQTEYQASLVVTHFLIRDPSKGTYVLG